MDLGEGWEKKALIIVAVVVFMLVAYAYNPFQSKANVTTSNQSYTPPATSTPVSQTPVVSNNSSNSSSNTTNNFLISSAQAKSIAINANPGYKASDPMQGTVVVNQTTIAVWMVPISKITQPSKTVYVDVNTGKIVNTT